MRRDIIEKICGVIPDRLFISLVYARHFKRFPDLKNPKTFNEKLQWLKLNYRYDEQTILVDKYLAKEYVAKKIGSEFIIPTLEKWSCIKDFSVATLPDQFVLKCNHDSGSVIICKNKNELNEEKIKKTFEPKLKNNGYLYGREWPYKNVKPLIMAEELLVDESGDLKDYKFFCFNGKVKCFKIDFDRFTNHGANYYSRSCELLEIGEMVCPPNFQKKIVIPDKINEMIKYAELLSEGYPFMRVDLYLVKDRIYFGEMTFYPASGFSPFTSEKWDIELGEWLVLPTKGGEE